MSGNLRALAERYLEILSTGAINDAGAIFSDKLVWQFGAAPPVTGVDDWKSMVGQWLGAFPDLKPISSDIVCDESAGRFAVRMRWAATHTGEFMGIAATGRAVVNEGVSMFRAENGMIVEEWIFEDVVNLTNQLQCLD